MITRAIPVLILTALATTAAERQDMIRFSNGDQLRGRFGSIHEGPTVKWLHDDLAAPAEFKTSSIHQIVFHEGQPQQVLRNLSHVELTNRDRFPGTMISLDDDKLTLDTEYAGIIHIPRDQISMIAPNPMGGRLHYSGPFAADEWEIINANPGNEASSDGEAADNTGKWQFTGSSWIWKAGKNPESILARKTGIPEISVIRFNLSWKNRLSLAIALHPDFARPAEDDVGENPRRRTFNSMDARSLARAFGNSDIIHLNSQYLNCLPTRLDQDGKINLPRRANSFQSIRLGDTGKALVEIRSNRNTGHTLIFINDEFTAQWNSRELTEDPALAPLTSEAIGFITMGSESQIRISDIVICEWNGMPDSARSLQVDEQDIVLMANGTDRYAGKVGGLAAEGILEFDGKYGKFKLPLKEIAEIRFARGSLATVPDAAPSGILMRMGPIGAISGTPIRSGPGFIELLNPNTGKIQISLKPVTLIDFNPSHIVIDDWSHDF
jgi:hypothetical protein